jgi:hypothetical protein
VFDGCPPWIKKKQNAFEVDNVDRPPISSLITQ